MSIDPVMRPGNGLLLIALQSAEDTIASPSAATDIIPCENDSISFNMPYKYETADEVSGSFASGAPLVVGQAATFSFKSRIKGAGPGATYTSSVKPPLHAALSACGWLGVFTAAVSAAALAAGTTNSATLGTGFAATAQIYRGMPLLLTGAPAAGRFPLITDYTSGKVATLADAYGSALTTANTAAIPANWTYAPTSPYDASSRAAMHPAATINYYEDGRLYQFMNCRGTVDMDGDTAKPGFATFNMTGIFVGVFDVAVPSNTAYPSQSAPTLVQGSGVAPAFQVNRRGLAISKWSLKNGGQIDSPEDPNSNIGFGAGQISDRTYMMEIDPLMTFVANRNSLADIAAFSQFPAAIQLGSVAGNRASIMLPLVQPVESDPGTRGKLRSETLRFQAVSPGRDNSGRDGDISLCFS
jgi:hypothetical protein